MMPAKLKALVEKGKTQEGWTSAADIVREMEGEREMTLQWKGREGGAEERMMEARGRPNLSKTCFHSQTERALMHR